MPALRMRSLTEFLAAALVLASPAPALAQAPSGDPATTPSFAQGSPFRILLDQLNGSVEVRNEKGRVLEHWTPGSGNRSTPLASIPPRRPVVVEVLNANPLLYRYEVAAAVVARGNQKSCTGIGGRFASTGFLTSLTGMPGQPSMMPPMDPAGGGQVYLPPPVTESAGTRGEQQMTRSFVESAAAQLRPAVATYLRFLQRLQSVPASLDDSLAAIAELGESVPLDTLLGRLQQSVAGALPGLHTAAQVPAVVRQFVASARGQLPDLQGFVRAIRSGEYQGDVNEAAPRELLGLGAEVEKAEKDLQTSARRLQAQLRRIELARQGTHQTFTLEASNDYRRISLQVQPTTEFPDALRLRVGTQELFSQPVVSILCDISLGVAFMDKPPKYATENGTLVDREASAERTAPTFMVHVAATKLRWIGALAGLGFGSNGRPDFYLGGSARLLEPLLVNLGVVWQRVDQLPAGMALGDAVADPLVLNDLPRRYRAGFFWGFSLGR